MSLLSPLPAVVRTSRFLFMDKSLRIRHRPRIEPASLQRTTTPCWLPSYYRLYSTTARNDFSSKDSFSGSNGNPGLESVIGQGLASLTQTAKDVQSKTKKVKSIESPSAAATTGTSTTTTLGQKLASHKQLAESQRLLDVATECLDALCDKHPNHPLLTIGGEPIAILDVQVNTNAKQAKVYWSLPYGILMDDRLTRSTYQKLVTRMETNLLQGGGASLLQKMVHTRLRFYYPPKLKLIAAPPQMVAEAVGDFSIMDEVETTTRKDS